MNLKNAESINLHDAGYAGSFCRLCADKSDSPLISIFCGGSNNFAMKLMFYLPIKVTESDSMPLEICMTCLDSILRWDDFYQNFVEADRKLRSACFEVKEEPPNLDHSEDAMYDDYVSYGQDSRATNSTNNLLNTSEPTQGYRTRNSMKRNNDEDLLKVMKVVDEQDRASNQAELLIEGSDEYYSHADLLEPIRFRPPIKIIRTCKECHITFPADEKIAIHMLEKHNKHHYLQSLLRQQLNKFDEVTTSRESKIGKGSYQCKYCFRIFTSPSKLSVHRRTHTGQRPFHCLLCTKTFRQTCHAIAHMKLTHFNIRSYPTRNSMKRNDDVDLHKVMKMVDEQDRASNQAELSIEGSDEDYSDAYLLEPKIIRTCKDCSITFPADEKIAIHMLEKHNKHQYLQLLWRQQLKKIDKRTTSRESKIGTGSYKCKYCSRIFTSPSKLSVHLRTHTGQRPFNCFLCTKTFRQTTHAIRHMKLTHFNNKSYRTRNSIKRNDDEDLLKVMKMVDEQDRASNQAELPIEGSDEDYSDADLLEPKIIRTCKDCSITFPADEKIAIHMLEKHNKHQYLQLLWRQQLKKIDKQTTSRESKIGTGSYKCKYCSRIFTSPSKLSVHLRTHTGQRPFNCFLCTKTFRQTTHAIRHMKLTHFNIRRLECSLSEADPDLDS